MANLVVNHGFTGLLIDGSSINIDLARQFYTHHQETKLFVPTLLNTFITAENMIVGLALVPIAVLSNYAGIWLVRRTSNELFFRIAYVLMLVIAVELIRGSIAKLWWG